MGKFSLRNLFSDFQSSKIDTEELEKIIIDAVSRENPNNSIEDIEYDDEGIKVILDDGTSIDIEIDWQEFILV